MAIVDLSTVHDDGGVPDAFDEFSGKWKTELSRETAAEVVYVKEDFRHIGRARNAKV